MLPKCDPFKEIQMLQRSRNSERRKLNVTTPWPVTENTTGACPGYVIDHVIPLKRGGSDSPDKHTMANSGGRQGEGQSGVDAPGSRRE
jgi:hypothetical protein